MPMTDPYTLETTEVRRAANAAASTYDEAAALQAEVRKRLLERLDYVKLEPDVVLDLGAATGGASRSLGERYGDAQIVAVDFADRMLRRIAERDLPAKAPGLLCADAVALPLASDSVDLIFCNLLLPWCNEPGRVLQECRRVLKPGGLFNFSALGPDTLYEMREAWSSVNGASHVHRFADMHDVGDAVVAAGFAEPVLDLEYITLCYRSVDGIMRELKACGAHNATAGRSRGLTGAGSLRLVESAYEKFRDADGRLPV
ncbi:MAG: methyltransferase domain-containing protein, partial [Gammaproteobacteria bacterium]|nr:methyltransferase domain-containing protein [Gammaproteobacteria bacterium]